MQEDSYATILDRLRANAPAFARKHLELAQTEIGEIVRANLGAAAWCAAALVFVSLIGVAFVILVVALFALLLPLWAAALVTMLHFALVAAILALIGLRKLELNGPERTIAQWKESYEWLKKRLSRPNASS